MDYDEFHSKVMAELDRRFADKGRGAFARIQREMEVNPTYFRQWRGGAKIQIPKLLQALELLDVDFFEFIATAFCPSHLEGELKVMLAGDSPTLESLTPVTKSGKRALALALRGPEDE